MEISMKSNPYMQKIVKIIKYDTRREYFGNWTPAQIYTAFHDALENPNHGISIFTGTISVNGICGALWNEMSYNPLHFGYENPFFFNGKNDIEQFCRKNTQDKSLISVQENLRKFLSVTKKIDTNFATTNKLSENNVTIISTYDRISLNYVMLSCLSKAIHKISETNLYDFKHSKKHRKKIIEIVQIRHPDLIRHKPNADFDRIAAYNAESKSIEQQIYELNTEIDSISYVIQDKQEYEQPIDTTYEKTKIANINQKINNLMSRYEYIQYQIKSLSRSR